MYFGFQLACYINMTMSSNTDTLMHPAMDYAFMVQTCDLPPGAAATSGEKQAALIAEALMALWEPLEKSLESFDHGGWRILSHDLMQAHGSLIVTFLICRQRRGNPISSQE